jgi:hypothetical protein
MVEKIRSSSNNSSPYTITAIDKNGMVQISAVISGAA